MAPEVRRAAEKYVREQVRRFDGKVAKKDVDQAIRKVAAALEEVRSARSETQRQGINLK